MTITADKVMSLAGIALNDVGANRWRLSELVQWLNEAVGAIILAQPAASSSTVTLTLQAGTYQTIGTAYLRLLRPVRNIASVGPPRTGGRFVAVTTRDMLDAQLPYWHDSTQTPYKKEVRQIVFDEEVPRDFYVYPGNDGTGIIEAVVSKMPTPIAAAGDNETLSSYAQDIGLPDVYLTPALEYVLYRALSKDSPEAEPQAALVHYQYFAQALGIDAKVLIGSSPNAATVMRAAAAKAAAPGG